MAQIAMFITMTLVLSTDVQETPASRMRDILMEARVPTRLHDNYAAVAWCESRWKPDAIGDGGSAVGLYQIHPMWVRWAAIQGYGWLDRLDPVENARLAYLVGQHYDLPRYGNRWGQWNAKPWFSACQDFPKEGWNFQRVHIPGAI